MHRLIKSSTASFNMMRNLLLAIIHMSTLMHLIFYHTLNHMQPQVNYAQLAYVSVPQNHTASSLVPQVFKRHGLSSLCHPHGAPVGLQSLLCPLPCHFVVASVSPRAHELRALPLMHHPTGASMPGASPIVSLQAARSLRCPPGCAPPSGVPHFFEFIPLRAF